MPREHISKQPRNVLLTRPPRSNEGRDGDTRYWLLDGVLYEGVRYNNRWYTRKFERPHDEVFDNNIIYPVFTVSGTPSSRVIQIDIKRVYDDKLPENTFILLHWYISSDSSWNPIVMAGTQTVAVNYGFKIEPTSTANDGKFYKVITCSSGFFKITISNTHSSNEVTYYFRVSVQDFMYSASFTVNTTS